MIVNWKKTRINIIPLGKTNIEMIKKIGKDKIILLPGHNDIDDSVWNEICQMSSIKNNKYIEEVSCETKEIEMDVKRVNRKGEEIIDKKTVEQKVGKALKDMNAEEAKKIIDETFNVETLKKWKKEDNRADVRNVIEDKIKEIKDYKVDPNIGKER